MPQRIPQRAVLDVGSTASAVPRGQHLVGGHDIEVCAAARRNGSVIGLYVSRGGGDGTVEHDWRRLRILRYVSCGVDETTGKEV
jgi:hypothetical protein